MHIIVADDLPASARALLEAEGWTVDARAGRPVEQLAADLVDADALVVRSATRVTPVLIAAAPRLRAIARAGTGVDNVDVAAASARGIVVMNAPGANSISVAELAMAQLLALARKLPAADASMKAGRWDKKAFLGEEVRGKVLGLAGFGRIGQEVARRARAFGMTILAHDPFIARTVADEWGVELVSLDELVGRADYVSLHMPSTPETRRIFGADLFARCKRGLRIINTARGDLIDEPALVAALQSGQVGGAALDVFTSEPTTDHTLQQLPQVVASPHIAASTREGQELVGVETATALRDFLKTGVIRNAVNFPTVPPEEYQRLQPYLRLAERLGFILGHLGSARIEGVGVRYYGELASGPNPLLVSAVLVGLFRAILQDTVTPVNARSIAHDRGIDVIESVSSRPRPLRAVLSVKLKTDAGDRWIEGTSVNRQARICLLDGVEIEAPAEGTLLVIGNHDQPGVIGEVGTILGRHDINIANFALGRGEHGAVGIVSVDNHDGRLDETVLREIRAAKAVKTASLVGEA
ncbi:MAG: phosphoglycerate dehydrogenase [Vicinamibacterales bacterium]